MSTPAHRSPRRTDRKRSNSTTGLLAEELVAQWLMQQHGEILQRRWHCRWGELDLVAQLPTSVDRPFAQTTIAFVEVKARRENNWDLDGILSITAQKQQKLIKTAELFLADYPHLANLPCRFDVALVHIHAHNRKAAVADNQNSLLDELNVPEPIDLGKSVTFGGHNLSLQHYIPAAFDLT